MFIRISLSSHGVKFGRKVNSLVDGQLLRMFNVINYFNREGLAIEVDLSLQNQRVIRALELIIERRDRPDAIRLNTGLPAAVNSFYKNYTSSAMILLRISACSSSEILP